MKVIAFVLCFIFMWNTICMSAPDTVHRLRIPASLGSVIQRWQAKEPVVDDGVDSDDSVKTVVIVQDAHISSQAQKNIQSIIRDLSEKNDVALIGVEGAEGSINTTEYSSFPIQRVREAVTDAYICKGRISGTDAAAINIDSERVHFYGVEDEGEYKRHFAVYKRIVSLRAAFEKSADEIQNVFTEYKKSVFNDKQKKLDVLISAYRNHELDFSAYALALIKLSDGYIQESNEYTYLRLFLDLSKIQMRLEGDLNKNQITALKKAYDKKKGLLDYARLIQECESLSYELLSFYSDSGRDLVKTIWFMDLIEDMVHLRALPFQVEKFNFLVDAGVVNDLLLFLESQGVFASEKEAGVFTSQLNDVVAVVQQFYSIAISRNNTLLSNLLNASEMLDADMPVLVAGGYHTRGITDLLRERNTSYAVVSPNVADAECDLSYDALMNGAVLPIERAIMTTQSTLKMPTELKNIIQGSSAKDSFRLGLLTSLYLNGLEIEIEGVRRKIETSTDLQQLWSDYHTDLNGWAPFQEVIEKVKADDVFLVDSGAVVINGVEFSDSLPRMNMILKLPTEKDSPKKGLITRIKDESGAQIDVNAYLDADEKNDSLMSEIQRLVKEGHDVKALDLIVETTQASTDEDLKEFLSYLSFYFTTRFQYSLKDLKKKESSQKEKTLLLPAYERKRAVRWLETDADEFKSQVRLKNSTTLMNILVGAKSINTKIIVGDGLDAKSVMNLLRSAISESPKDVKSKIGEFLSSEDMQKNPLYIGAIRSKKDKWGSRALYEVSPKENIIGINEYLLNSEDKRTLLPVLFAKALRQIVGVESENKKYQITPSDEVLFQRDSADVSLSDSLQTVYKEIDEKRYYPFPALIARVEKSLCSSFIKYDPETQENIKPIYDQTKKICERVLTAAGLNAEDFTFNLVDDDSLNAFVLPYAKSVYMNIGLLRVAAEFNQGQISERIIAAVLAHEVGHLLQFREKAARGDHWEDYDLLNSLVRVPDLTEVLKILYERYAMEYDADGHIPQILDAAGYSVKGGEELFDLLKSYNASSFVKRMASYADVHPETYQRVDSLREITRKRAWKNYHKKAEYYSKEALECLYNQHQQKELIGRCYLKPTLGNLTKAVAECRTPDTLFQLMSVVYPYVLRFSFPFAREKKIDRLFDAYYKKCDELGSSFPLTVESNAEAVVDFLESKGIKRVPERSSQLGDIIDKEDFLRKFNEPPVKFVSFLDCVKAALKQIVKGKHGFLSASLSILGFFGAVYFLAGWFVSVSGLIDQYSYLSNLFFDLAALKSKWSLILVPFCFLGTIAFVEIRKKVKEKKGDPYLVCAVMSRNERLKKMWESLGDLPFDSVSDSSSFADYVLCNFNLSRIGNDVIDLSQKEKREWARKMQAVLDEKDVSAGVEVLRNISSSNTVSSVLVKEEGLFELSLIEEAQFHALSSQFGLRAVKRGYAIERIAEVLALESVALVADLFASDDSSMTFALMNVGVSLPSIPLFRVDADRALILKVYEEYLKSELSLLRYPVLQYIYYFFSYNRKIDDDVSFSLKNQSDNEVFDQFTKNMFVNMDESFLNRLFFDVFLRKSPENRKDEHRMIQASDALKRKLGFGVVLGADKYESDERLISKGGSDGLAKFMQSHSGLESAVGSLSKLLPFLTLNDIAASDNTHERGSLLSILKGVYWGELYGKWIEGVSELQFYEEFLSLYIKYFSQDNLKPVDTDDMVQNFVLATAGADPDYLVDSAENILDELGISCSQRVGLNLAAYIYMLYHVSALGHNILRSVIVQSVWEKQEIQNGFLNGLMLGKGIVSLDGPVPDFSSQDVEILNRFMRRVVEKKRSDWGFLTASDLDSLNWEKSRDAETKDKVRGVDVPKNKDGWEKARQSSYEHMLKIRSWEEYALFAGQIVFYEKAGVLSEKIDSVGSGFFEAENDVDRVFFGEMGLQKSSDISLLQESAYLEALDEFNRKMISLFIKEDVKAFSRNQLMGIDPDEMAGYFAFLDESRMSYDELKNLILKTLPRSVYRNYCLMYLFLYKGIELERDVLSERISQDVIREKIEEKDRSSQLRIKERAKELLPKIASDRRIEGANQIGLFNAVRFFDSERNKEGLFPMAVLVSTFFIGIGINVMMFFIQNWDLITHPSVMAYICFSIVFTRGLSFLEQVSATFERLLEKASFTLFSRLSPIDIGIWEFVNVAVLGVAYFLFPDVLSFVSKGIWSVILLPVNIFIGFIVMFFVDVVFTYLNLKLNLTFNLVRILSSRIELPGFLETMFRSWTGVKKKQQQQDFTVKIGAIIVTLLSVLLFFPMHVVHFIYCSLHTFRYAFLRRKLNMFRMKLKAEDDLDKESIIDWIIDKKLHAVGFVDRVILEQKKEESSESGGDKDGSVKDEIDKKEQREKAIKERKARLEQSAREYLQERSIKRILQYADDRLIMHEYHLWRNFKFTGVFYKVFNDRKMKKAHERDSHKYDDFRFYRFGGRHSQVDDILRDIIGDDNQVLRLSENDSYEKSLTSIKCIYPFVSSRRDEHLLKLLNRIKEDVYASQDSSLLFNAYRALEEIKDLFSQGPTRLDIQYEMLNLDIALNPSVLDTFEGEFGLIRKHFPDPSYMRDDILKTLMKRTEHPEEAEQVQRLFLADKQNVMHADNSRTIFLGDKSLLVFQNMAVEEKHELMLWILGVTTEKPLFLKEYENYLQIDFSPILETLTSESSGRYPNVGEASRKVFLDAMLFGSNGVFSTDKRRASFLKDVYNHFMPDSFEDKAMLRKVFLTVFSKLDIDHQSRVMHSMLGKLKHMIKDPDSTEGKDAGYQAISAFMESLGLIGTKLGQILGFSELIDDPELRAVLQNLSDEATPLSNLFVFRQVKELYGEWPYKRLVRVLGSGSIGIVFQVELLDGTMEVIKLKRPEVEQLLDYEVETLSDIIKELGSWRNRIRLPESIVEQLEIIVSSETDFDEEGGNPMLFSNRVRSRWHGHRKFNFVLPKTKVVKQNVFISWEYMDGLISLRQLRTRQEIETSIRQKTLGHSVSASEIKEQVDEEIQSVCESLQIESSGYDEIIVSLRNEIYGNVLTELMSQIFIDGHYHADPHGGNVLLRKGDEGKIDIVLTDWGSTSKVKTEKEKWGIVWWLIKRRVFDNPVCRFLSGVWGIGPFFSIEPPVDNVMVSTFFAKTGYLYETLSEEKLLTLVVDKTGINREAIWNNRFLKNRSLGVRLGLASLYLSLYTKKEMDLTPVTHQFGANKVLYVDRQTLTDLRWEGLTKVSGFDENEAVANIRELIRDYAGADVEIVISDFDDLVGQISRDINEAGSDKSYTVLYIDEEKRKEKISNLRAAGAVIYEGVLEPSRNMEMLTYYRDWNDFRANAGNADSVRLQADFFELFTRRWGAGPAVESIYVPALPIIKQVNKYSEESTEIAESLFKAIKKIQIKGLIRQAA